jgi:hypothetical protein
MLNSSSNLMARGSRFCSIHSSTEKRSEKWNVQIRLGSTENKTVTCLWCYGGCDTKSFFTAHVPLYNVSTRMHYFDSIKGLCNGLPNQPKMLKILFINPSSRLYKNEPQMGSGASLYFACPCMNIKYALHTTLQY